MGLYKALFMGKIDFHQTLAQGYKFFFMLNSDEREILNAHKYNKRALRP